MPSVTRIEVGTRPGFTDSLGSSVARRVREHLGLSPARVRTRDVFHVEAPLSAAEAEAVAREFAGPVVRQGGVGRIDDGPFDVAVSVGYRPGVTDPVAKSARVAIEDLLGRPLGEGAHVYTSRLYLLDGVSEAEAGRIARALLANEVIERVSVQPYAQWKASPPDLSVPRVVEHAARPVETVSLELPDEALQKLSRDRLLALSLEEMGTLRDFYRAAGSDPDRRAAGLGASPTDVELECLAQTWSEHCKHKIMNAVISYREDGGPSQEIRSIFKTFIRGTTDAVDQAIRAREGKSWLVSVFHDNAGVIEATERFHLVYKVETHNSPSALDPYGGAITGIVGVNRDPFGTGMGSDLLSNTWGYCFAPPGWKGELPPGLLHPRRIREGVHAGVIDGGNQSGQHIRNPTTKDRVSSVVIHGRLGVHDDQPGPGPGRLGGGGGDRHHRQGRPHRQEDVALPCRAERGRHHVWVERLTEPDRGRLLDPSADQTPGIRFPRVHPSQHIADRQANPAGQAFGPGW